MRKHTMNTWLIRLVTCVSLFSPATALAQSADWQIDNFDSEIIVHEDASLSIKETITVNFDAERHGIFREIPYTYEDEFGNRVKISLSVDQVWQDGEPATYTQSSLGGWTTIRIGDPDVLVSGLHVYEIDYQVERALLYFADHDELYWDVTGHDWEVPITSATAVVSLPDGSMISATDCYTGDYGSTSQDCGVALDGSVAAFASAGPMTVDVAFAKGVVYEPSTVQKIGLFFADNWLAVLPLILIIGVVMVWWKLGRDPKIGTVVAAYEPPAGLWAVYAGAMERGAVSKQDLVAMIVQLAVNGYLKIVESTTESAILKIDHQEITLVKLKEPTGLDAAHEALFRAIFGVRSEVKMSELKSSLKQSDITLVRKEIKRWLIEQKYYQERSFWLQTGLFILAGVIFFLGFFLAYDFGAVTVTMFGLCAGLTVIFAFYMPKRTLRGTQLLTEIKGFRLFMHTAERYRSAWQEKEKIFFDYLPYAIAFGDVKHWSSVFADTVTGYPQWYQGSSGFVSMDLLARNLGTMTTSMASAVTPAAPAGSGSGGGGFSGGGFGGGGGGSW